MFTTSINTRIKKKNKNKMINIKHIKNNMDFIICWKNQGKI